jgi:hypothetical protein
VVPNLRADEDRIDVAEHDSALEMAEVLLSFGRVRGAAQTLEEHIEANPKETVRPWLRLLELYREEGMRAEFEALARRLNQTFNVEMMAWSQKPRRRNPDSLERYPHIVARLVECWNTPACADYLDQLLHDNRNGKRAGFSAEVLEEILLLATIRDRNAGTQERAAAPDSQRSPATRRETPLATTATAAKQAASSPRSAPRPLIHLLARDGNRPPQHASGQNAAG